MKVSRRTFLKGTGGALVAASCYPRLPLEEDMIHLPEMETAGTGLRIDQPEYWRLGKAKTGRPGSRRVPRFCGTQSVSVSGNRSLMLDPQLFENDTEHVWFVDRVAISVGNSEGATRTSIQIRPTFGLPWTSGPLAVRTVFDSDGVTFDPGGETRVLFLREPFPMPPRSSFEIMLQTTSSSAESHSVGVLGYLETEPAYTKPVLTPYIIGGRLASTLATGSSDRFPEALLYPGVKFLSDRLSLKITNAAIFTNSDLVLVRVAVKGPGRPRVLETGVPVYALQDQYTGGLPLFDTVLEAGDGFQVELLNTSAVTAFDTIDCAVFGYRI